MVTAEHVRVATGKQLAALVGVSENTVSAWTLGMSRISGLTLHRAASRGIPKESLVQGLDLRREDALRARQLQAEVDEFLAGIEVLNEAA